MIPILVYSNGIISLNHKHGKSEHIIVRTVIVNLLQAEAQPQSVFHKCE